MTGAILGTQHDWGDYERERMHSIFQLCSVVILPSVALPTQASKMLPEGEETHC